MSKITEEITYTAGKLAKKLGISKDRLKNHLRNTGLIEQCWSTKGGHWRIPYSVAVRISSAEALSIPLPTPISRRAGRQNVSPQNVSPQNVNEPKPVYIPDYTQIGRSLRRAGVTMKDLLQYIEKEMRVTHENFQDNSTQRNDENPADGSKTTNGSAGSNIPNSSEK